MSVTGSAIMTFTGKDNASNGNGWSMSDTMSFSGSGELDNGWTVSMSHAIDNGANDANSITIDMGDAGKLTFAGLGGSGPVEATDDVMPTANEESWATVAGTVSGLADGSEGNNNFTYVFPSLMDGLALEVFHQPQDAAQGSSTEMKAVFTGVDGLEIGYAGGENNDTLTNAIDNTNLWAKYTFDAFTVGYQSNQEDEQTASADTDFTAVGVSYALSDELSISYGTSKTDHENTSLQDQDAQAVSFSYVSGGMTIGGSMHSVDNVAGAAATDNSGYELNITFAF
jgi:outer membrane protein OmpU